MLPLPTPLTTSPSAHHLALSACSFSSLLSLPPFLFLFFSLSALFSVSLALSLSPPLFISLALSRAVLACQPPVNILPAEAESEVGLSHSLTAVGSLFSTPLQSLEMRTACLPQRHTGPLRNADPPKPGGGSPHLLV